MRWWEHLALVASGLGAVLVVINPVPNLGFLRWTWLRVLLVLAFGFQAFYTGSVRGNGSTSGTA